MINIKNITTILGLLSLLSTTTANATNCNGAASCEELGYKKQTCDDGLKCFFDPTYAYCPPKNGIENGLCYENDVLVGVQVGNSNLCVALEEAGTENWSEAMAACDNGWHLPSCKSETEDSGCELYTVYQNKSTINSKLSSNGGTQLSVTYWSSTEYSSSNAYSISMFGGSVSYNDKNGSRYVRCVRGF